MFGERSDASFQATNKVCERLKQHRPTLIRARCFTWHGLAFEPQEQHKSPYPDQ